MTSTRAFIFARGGSKGIPKKNLRIIGNQPLFVHGILLARKIKEINKVYVSTDCHEIASIAIANKADLRCSLEL